MFNWSPFPFVRFAVLMSIGILLYEVVELPWLDKWWVVFSVLLSLFIVLTITGASRVNTGVVGLVLFTYLGILRAFLGDVTRSPSHISNVLEDSIYVASGTILSASVVGNGGSKFLVELDSVLTREGPKTTFGKAHLFVNGNHPDTISTGDRVLYSGRMTAVRNRGNPNEFDYAGYLAASGIHGQSFIDAEAIRLLEKSGEFRITAAVGSGRAKALALLDQIYPYR